MKTTAFDRRLRERYDELKWLYCELYQNGQEAFQGFVEMLRRCWGQRKQPLRARDARRESEPDWYRRRDLLGMMLYVDAFAGDLAGVRGRLDYIRACGVNYLHLMPLLQSPKGRSDGGYAVSDFRAVQPELGSMDDLEALAAGPQTPFDLIDCNGRLGLDVVCAGVDARIAAGVHRYKDWWFVSGIGAYILSLLENIFFKGIARRITVHMGDIRWEDRPACLLCVCNGRHYGGGFMPVGEAMPDDGVLDMLLVKKVGLFTFLRLVGQYGKGRYKEYPELILDYHGQQVSFSAREPVTVVVDGEVMRDTAFTVRLSEKKVNFFYPAGAGYQVSSADKTS